ncbi:hypothetical protein MSG28_001207 [Choristoneura fumiferana]|uniref:Uncharacterized protein n=1 Tax=Choristoneura fumiferana TaxID=7141 RepID=A0ACC0K4P1_CHOFU|nr:hypothetical protein MSG28_001207 [Choristoneura fumiferana]
MGETCNCLPSCANIQYDAEILKTTFDFKNNYEENMRINTKNKIKYDLVLATMSNIKRFCCDDETGEVITYFVNDETGEPTPVSSLAMQSAPRATTSKTISFPKGYMSETKKFQNLKANIIDGSNVFSPRLLLIPSAALCPAICMVLLAILELFLHVSPLHIVTSVFCGVCRECNTMTKIEQLQDERRCRYDYLKRIAI